MLYGVLTLPALGLCVYECAYKRVYMCASAHTSTCACMCCMCGNVCLYTCVYAYMCMVFAHTCSGVNCVYMCGGTCAQMHTC